MFIFNTKFLNYIFYQNNNLKHIVLKLQERKTALYIAVEKGNTAIIKLLLGANPDLEISTKVSSLYYYQCLYIFSP